MAEERAFQVKETAESPKWKAYWMCLRNSEEASMAEVEQMGRGGQQ